MLLGKLHGPNVELSERFGFWKVTQAENWEKIPDVPDLKIINS